MKVSVIVPIYNVEKYLNRCMDSLLNQTLKDIEFILVDDGSPDRCPVMCDEYARKDSRIKVIHKKNAGLGYARNSGLEIATGEFVAFVDSDDFVDTSMYEALYNEAVSSNADAVFCGFKTETQHDVWVDSNEVSCRTEWNGEQVNEFMLDMVACAPHVSVERKYQMSVWHSIYRRNVITDNNIQFLSERDLASEDIPFQVDFLLRSRKIVYLPQSYYHYCLNGTSLTATFLPERFDRFKYLHHVLNEKLNGIQNSVLRVDRFFIGCMRIQLLHLTNSNFKNKQEEIRRICNDSIWKEISSRFSPSYLTVYPSIVYRLILEKKISILALFYKFIVLIKKLSPHCSRL